MSDVAPPAPPLKKKASLKKKNSNKTSPPKVRASLLLQHIRRRAARKPANENSAKCSVHCMQASEVSPSKTIRVFKNGDIHHHGVKVCTRFSNKRNCGSAQVVINSRQLTTMQVRRSIRLIVDQSLVSLEERFLLVSLDDT